MANKIRIVKIIYFFMIGIMMFILPIIIIITARQNENILQQENQALFENHVKYIKKIGQEKRDIQFILSVNPEIPYQDIFKIKPAFEKYSKNSGISAKKFMAICAHESKFNKKAVSKTDDHGICQINRSTYGMIVRQHKMKYEFSRLYEIDYNVMIASLVLADIRTSLEKIYKSSARSVIDVYQIMWYNDYMNNFNTDYKKMVDIAEELINRK